MPNTVIRTDNISKRYRLGTYEQAQTFAERLKRVVSYPLKNLRRISQLSRFGDANDSSVLWALKDISFTVERGAVLGIIGRNGAGKSTLLKVLSKITEPTTGRIEIEGRVSSLLEVGTGFHPELSGRDNIYMNGTILGMTRKEIDQKFDQIVEFAGIAKHIDTPVKFYSSGMTVRLGFSVAAHLEPEILIVDEVLAVGDFEFQKKCLGKMNDVAQSGRTVLFVSHNMAAVQNLCTSCMLIRDGKIIDKGPTAKIIDLYLKDNIEQNQTLFNQRSLSEGVKAIVTSIELMDGTGDKMESLLTGQAFNLQFHIEAYADLKNVRLEIGIDSAQGERLAYFNNEIIDQNIGLTKGKNTVRLGLNKLPLLPGTYFVSYSLTVDSDRIERIEHAYSFHVESGDFYGTGRLSQHEPSKILLEYSMETVNQN